MPNTLRIHHTPPCVRTLLPTITCGCLLLGHRQSLSCVCMYVVSTIRYRLFTIHICGCGRSPERPGYQLPRDIEPVSFFLPANNTPHQYSAPFVHVAPLSARPAVLLRDRHSRVCMHTAGRWGVEYYTPHSVSQLCTIYGYPLQSTELL